jgi:hypothetical protein
MQRTLAQTRCKSPEAPGTSQRPMTNVWTAYAYDDAGNMVSMADGRGRAP